MDLSKLICAKMLEKDSSRQINTETGKRGRRHLRRILFIGFLFLLLTLTGCVTLPDPETSQDYDKTTVAVVSPDQSVGQSFIARRPRLNGIHLWFESESQSQLLKVELFHRPGEATPVFSGNISAGNGKTLITIPPQTAPPNQRYYLRVSQPSGEIRLLGRAEDQYPRGTAFVNDQPIAADLAFRTTYEYALGAAFSDFRGILTRWYLLFPLGIVLLLPGWLLLDFSKRQDQFDWGEKIAIALGVSLASIPLLMLWTSLVGLRWGPISVWLVAGTLLTLLAWRILKRPRTAPRTPHASIWHPAALILLTIFAITLFTRFAMIRDLTAPPWVDPIHHSLITHRMLESGGSPATYAPHLPPEADYYHFGFHSALASFTWLTGFEIHTGILIFGQVLNALIVFAVYLLAKTLTNHRGAALTAALIAGLFTLMPAYYLSWGRYTQLAGLLVLPAGFRLFTEIAKSKRDWLTKEKSLWLLGTITFAGLFLIHYRVAAFLGVLMLAYLLAQISPKNWLPTLGRLLLLGIFSAILLLPWLPGTLTDLLIPKGDAWRGGIVNFSQIPWNFLKPALGEAALAMAGIGLILGIFLLQRFTITVLLWTGMMYLLANLGVFRLPGAGFVNPVSMEITLFMPIAILGGFAVGGALKIGDKLLPARWQRLPRVLFILLGFGAAILGAQRLLPTLNPVTFLARTADFPAIEWIGEHIPEDETILLNPTGWGYGLYMGNDGGYWLSAITGHQTMPPPVLYGLGSQAETTRINQIIENVLPIGEDAAALFALMQAENIRFVYTGARGGVISPQALAESELFTARYQKDGVWLFESVPPAR